MSTKKESGTDGNSLLSVFGSIHTSNEERITRQDREFCEAQEALLYQSLEQIERWYSLFKDEAAKYEDHHVSYNADGTVNVRYPHTKPSYTPSLYKDFELKPFELISKLAKNSFSAHYCFAREVVAYFNQTYGTTIPLPDIQKEDVPFGHRSRYTTYVDYVFEHLAGKTFSEHAEQEITGRLRKAVTPGPYGKGKLPELRGSKLHLHDVIAFDRFYEKNHVDHSYYTELDAICESAAFFGAGVVGGSADLLAGFDRYDVDLSRWYPMNTDSEISLKLYKNGRVDIRFADSEAAERCFKRMGLGSINLPEAGGVAACASASLPGLTHFP